jgi:hypothetical protein
MSARCQPSTSTTTADGGQTTADSARGLPATSTSAACAGSTLTKAASLGALRLSASMSTCMDGQRRSIRDRLRV